MDFLRQLIAGVVQTWRRLSISARINLVLAALVTTALVAVMVFSASRPNYVRLFDGLDPSETSQIAEAIRQAGVTPKIENGGRNVLVPLDRLSDMKMAVLALGLPTSHGRARGFELFDQEGLTTNRMLHDVKYMRALQGELQRHLNEFDFVSKSFVMIREAEEQLFTAYQEPSQATVTLDVGRSPTKQEVKAVLHTISSFGGANLGIDNIALMTTDGTPLHLPPTSEFASIANSKLEYIAELERHRERRAIEDLERLGLQAVVRVSAVVDFDQQTETTTKSEDGAILSAQAITTKTTSKEELPEGTPGARAHLPEGAAAPGGTTTEETSEETTENFEPSLTKTEVVRSPGKVVSYQVSAIIEGETDPDTEEYVGLTDEKKKVYEEHIAAAVGEGETPTTVTINDHPFDITRVAAAQEAFAATRMADALSGFLPVLKLLLQGGLIIILFWMARRMLLKAIVTTEEEDERRLERPEPTSEDLRREEINTEVARMSQEDPEAVAQLLRSWIAQDEES